MAKHWALIFLLTYLLVLTGVSLINIGNIPSLGSSIDDKIFHFVSHVVLTGLCYNYFKKTTTSKPLLVTALAPMFYGIAIEWLQTFGSSMRTADAYDVVANIFGMIFAVLCISIAINVKLK